MVAWAEHRYTAFLRVRSLGYAIRLAVAERSTTFERWESELGRRGPILTLSYELPPAIGVIPTVSEWGMLALLLLVLAAGTIVFRRVKLPV